MKKKNKKPVELFCKHYHSHAAVDRISDYINFNFTEFQNRTHELLEQAEEILEQTKQAEVPTSSIPIPEQTGEQS